MVENMEMRIDRIFSGTVSQLVSSVEDPLPLKVLDQALGETEEAIQEVRGELGTIEAQCHATSNCLTERQAQHQDLCKKIHLALREHREDLAEAAAEMLIEIEADIPALEQAYGKTERRREQLEDYLNALKGRCRELQNEIKRYRGKVPLWPGPDGTVTAPSQSNAAVPFTIHEAASSAHRNRGFGHAADAESARKLAELEALSDKAKIRDRLARFKDEHF